MSQVVLVAALFVVLQICVTSSSPPPCPESGLPEMCACEFDYRDRRGIRCYSVPTSHDLKPMFDQIAKAASDNPVFDDLNIHYIDGDKVDIPANVMNGLAFNTISIGFPYQKPINIHPNAFPSTYDYTTTLTFGFGNFEDPFPFVRKFTNLNELWLSVDKLSSIPDYALFGLRFLERITLTPNSHNLKEVGKLAFASSPVLTWLDLGESGLDISTMSTHAFEGISSYAEVILDDNEDITYLPENIFKVLLDNVAKVNLKPFYEFSSRIACDVRANWICADFEKYKPKMNGFLCEGNTYEDIFEYCETRLCPLSSALPTECACSAVDPDRRLECDVTATTDLKAMFDQISQVAGNNLLFDTLDLNFATGQSQPIEIEQNLISQLKFKNINLRLSSQKVNIHPNPFPSTSEYTKRLEIIEADFEDTRDPFPMIRTFVNLEAVTITGGNLPKIEDLGFDRLKSVKEILINGSNVWAIGNLPFSNAPKLEVLNLAHNQLNVEGLSVGAFEGISSNTLVDLTGNNNLTFLPQNIFKTLLDKTVSVVIVGPPEDVDDNNHLVCDEKANWICENIANYEPKLKGFYCTGNEFKDVFDYCSKTIKKQNLI